MVGTTTKNRNPIVIIIFAGLAIIATVGIYTLLKPEPDLKVQSATYGYYFQESRVGKLKFASVGTETYQFEGEFTINITMGEVGGSFYGEVGDFRNSVPRLTSLGWSSEDSSLPSPTAIDAGILVAVTRQITFLLPPERWGGIHVGCSAQFTSMTPYSLPMLNVEMTSIGKDDIVVPSGTYENCFVVNGTQPDMNLEVTLWVTEQGVVPQAEITMALRGIDPVTLTMKLEYHE